MQAVVASWLGGDMLGGLFFFVLGLAFRGWWMDGVALGGGG